MNPTEAQRGAAIHRLMKAIQDVKDDLGIVVGQVNVEWIGTSSSLESNGMMMTSVHIKDQDKQQDKGGGVNAGGKAS